VWLRGCGVADELPSSEEASLNAAREMYGRPDRHRGSMAAVPHVGDGAAAHGLEPRVGRALVPAAALVDRGPGQQLVPVAGTVPPIRKSSTFWTMQRLPDRYAV